LLLGGGRPLRLWSMARVLRSYQVAGLGAIRDSVRQGVRRLVVQAPTGSGKTLLAAEIANGALRKGNKLAFVVPRIDLIDQTVTEFHDEGLDEVGVIQADHRMTDWSQPIQICSINTIRSRGKYPEANVVIFDEIHTCYEEHRAWMNDPAFTNVPFIGLSATPWAKGLGEQFESLLVLSTTKELIEQGYLSKFKVFAASHPDLKKVKVVAGEYQNDQLSDAMQQGSLTADIVDTWMKRWNQDKTLVFAVDRAHAAALQARFAEAGISAGYQDMRTSTIERAQIKRDFHSGKLRVVCNVDTLTMGVDWDVRCLSLCRPTRSEMRFVQIVGRALRIADGKDCAIILDHSDTTQRLGFVTDIHHEHLNGGRHPEKQERRKRLPKECPQCTSLMPAVQGTCPNCGFVRKVVSSIIEGDGELEEYVGGVLKKPKSRDWTMAEKATWYAQLKGWAREHGKKEGWAAHSYKAKFGAWPDWSIKHIQPQPPGTLVALYVRARNIAWAKSQRPHV